MTAYSLLTWASSFVFCIPSTSSDVIVIIIMIYDQDAENFITMFFNGSFDENDVS